MRLRMMIFDKEEKWKLFSGELWQKEYTYFRWSGFPP